jgi:hypothetical protein
MKAVVAVLSFCIALTGVASALDSLCVRRVGLCPLPRLIWEIVTREDLAYVACDDSGFYVVSLHNPVAPEILGHFPVQKNEYVYAVEVDGNYAYLSGNRGMRIVSVADPANPVEVGHYSGPGAAFGVGVAGNRAYVVAGDSGLRVISIADPANPVEVGHCILPGNAYDVAVAGGHAYVADNDSGLRVVSLADSAHPVEVGQYGTSGWTQHLALQGTCVYLAQVADSFRILSIADPAHPTSVGAFPGMEIYSSAVVGETVFLGDAVNLRVLSISDTAHPTEVGFWRGSGAVIKAVAADRHYIYAACSGGLQVFQYYTGVGDLDVDPDSLSAVDDTIRLKGPGSFDVGAFVLANTSAAYNPDTADGPSSSPIDSIHFTGSLTGHGDTLDSIFIRNLPESLAQGQTVICTLAVYVPPGLRFGSYTGAIVLAGRDTWNYQVAETVYARLAKLGDLDVDPDSLDAATDTVRLRPARLSQGPPPVFTRYALGRFVLANTDSSYNPDTSDGPSQSPVDSLRATGSLSGPGGTLDSVFILNLPDSLAQGQAIVCSLAVYMPPWLQDGDYDGSITITGKDSVGMMVEESFSALFKKTTLGDLDVDPDSFSLVHDTMNLHAQPAGPVYHPYAKAEFMLVNTSSVYNPDTSDGPSRSLLREFEVEVKVEGQNGSMDSVYVLNLPESLAVGQAVECTLALVLPVGTPTSGYAGVVTISALDTAGYEVQDSFYLVVRGPQPRENLDSLRVAPIPFKPNQNPEHDAIHFQGLSSGAKVVVYDASGQTVWTATENSDGHVEWDAKVASGIYVYLVVSADGKSSKVGKLSVIR